MQYDPSGALEVNLKSADSAITGAYAPNGARNIVVLSTDLTPAPVDRVVENGTITTPVSVTGVTGTQKLASVLIPGGSMGSKGVITVKSYWSYTNSANNKSLTYRFGSADDLNGTVFFNYVATTSATVVNEMTICNRGSESSQIGGPTALSSGNGNTSGAVITATIDTSQDTYLVISCNPVNSGDTITLEWAQVLVRYVD